MAMKKHFRARFLSSAGPPFISDEAGTGAEMLDSPRTSLVVHYAEIGTKGNNRGYFENQLAKNLSEALAPLGRFRVELVDQRVFLSSEDGPGALRAAEDALRGVFGVAWFAKVLECPLDFRAVKETSVSVMEGLLEASRPSSFRVTAKRANKAYELSSQQMAAKLGEELVKETGLRVDLSNPEVTLYVDILSDRVLVHTSKERGPGGLPVGVTGKVVHLLSGGIDSPVAAWLMMKRGCDPTYLHFYVAPAAEQILDTKMAALLKTLSRFGSGSASLILVPFVDYQVATAGLRPEFEPVVFRHFTRIVAEKVAARLGAAAVSTGDNLGQVASQTLYNLGCIDAGASMPTLRPLLAYDKSEIVKLAEEIGTYEDSIADYKDCCSIVSRHPKTRMNVEAVLEASLRYDFPALAERTISAAALVRCERDALELRKDPFQAIVPLERGA